MTRTIDEVTAELDALKAEAKTAKREQAKIRRAKEALERKNFRVKLEEDHNAHRFSDDTRHALWRMAWDRGHSSGYHDVKYEYEELIHLAGIISNEQKDAQQ